MSKLNGGYLGGSTTLSPKDTSWFSKKSMRVPHETAGARPPMSGSERQEFEEFSALPAPRLLHASDIDLMKMTPRQRAKHRRRKQ